MKKRRLKKNVKYGIIGVILFLFIIIFLIKFINYRNSDEYKLKEKGYNKEEIKEILNLDETKKNKILEIEYNENILKFVNEKYFLIKNIDRYLKYYEKNKDLKISKIISLVNVKADYEHYDKNIIKEADTSKGILMLVNKYNYLTENFQPELNKISVMYAYDDNELILESLNAYKKMWNAAKKENLTLIASSSYRSYDDQKKLWDYRAMIDQKEADLSTARPGFSEHQTGLSIDILTYNATLASFEETKEFKWLEKNSYKYGFILRYPKDKTDITGYEYESWHYRYVGIDIATKIYNENITFDEYYAYYEED